MSTGGYLISDDNGTERVDSMPELFDALIMRGLSAVDALIKIGEHIAESQPERCQRQ